MLCDFMCLLFVAALAVKFQKDCEEAIAKKTGVPVPARSPFWTYRDRLGKVHKELRE